VLHIFSFVTEQVQDQSHQARATQPSDAGQQLWAALIMGLVTAPGNTHITAVTCTAVACCRMCCWVGISTCAAAGPIQCVTGLYVHCRATAGQSAACLLLIVVASCWLLLLLLQSCAWCQQG
jgi:hypothetical protein